MLRFPARIPVIRSKKLSLNYQKSFSIFGNNRFFHKTRLSLDEEESESAKNSIQTLVGIPKQILSGRKLIITRKPGPSTQSGKRFFSIFEFNFFINLKKKKIK